MENDLEERNFATVADRLVSVVEYYQDTREQRLNRLFLVAQVVKRPHLIMRICQRLNQLEMESKMDYETYKKFTGKINKIKRDGIYLPPNAHFILWEKLSRLCYGYLHEFRNTEWGKKASLIIRGKDI